jgi:hypothetical protein
MGVGTEKYQRQRKINDCSSRQGLKRHLELELTVDKSSADPESDPSKPIKKITWSYHCKQTVELYPDIPLDKPQQPAPEEIQHAIQVSRAKSFHYFSHQNVVIMDRKESSKILEVIEFTPLKDLMQTK